MTDEPTHIATAAAALADPYAALSQQLHGDGDAPAMQRLIAAAPTLAADNLRLLNEIERLKRALVEAAIPLEAMILATQDDNAGRRLYGELLWNGIVAGVEAVRTALVKGGPDDR